MEWWLASLFTAVGFLAGTFTTLVVMFLSVLFMRRHPEATRPRKRGAGS
jgi:hypothetical protein